MNKKQISVVIPVYNVENYLSKCLDSVLEQSFANLEIILVDDGSTDNSPKICDSYKELDNRIIVIHQKNKGLSGARNSGIKVAQGEYIYFLDSDDWIEKNCLEELYQIATTTNSQVVVHNVNLCPTEDEKILKEYWPFKSTVSLLPDMIFPYFLIQPCWAWNKLYKTDFIKKNNLFFIEGVLYEDVPFFVDVFLLCQKIAFTPLYLYNYRVGRDGSITVKQSKKQFDLLKIAEIVTTKLKNKNVSQIVKDNFIQWKIYNFAWMYSHLPKICRKIAIERILKYDCADKALELIGLKYLFINLFGLPIFKLKKVTSRYDLFIFNIPIITLKKEKSKR